MLFDVVVIGAGVVGSFVARELSYYQLDVCVVEQENDVAMGTSKANSSIVHAGFDANPGSLKALLNVGGSQMMPEIASELDVPYKQIGSLVLSFSESEHSSLCQLYQRGLTNGVSGLTLLNKQQVLELEPNLSPNIYSALYAPSAGIICPYELTLGAMENAVNNGVILRLGINVKDVKWSNGEFGIITNKGTVRSKYVINCAGIFADTISRMIGDESYSITPRKGEYVLLDKTQGQIINRVIFQLPSQIGKGVLVTPTVDGNLLVGPNAELTKDKDDIATSFEGLNYVVEGAQKAVPGFNMKDIITSFAGLRASGTTGDFIIGPSDKNTNFINVAGIESPGLSSAPAIGEYVLNILKSNGLEMVKKRFFNPFRPRPVKISELTYDEIDRLIKKDADYGKIVCRCEKITKGEIRDSIHRTIGALDLDGVKRRTRAGMGRCQGGFCSPTIMEILADELNLEICEITKMGGNSKVLAGKTK